MISFKKIYKELILERTNFVTATQVIQAIDDQQIIHLGYDYSSRSPKEKSVRTTRPVRVYAYGISKAGNKIIRAHELQNYVDEFGNSIPTFSVSGDIPKWRTFRIDRINYWNVLGEQEEEFPTDITISYKRNDKTMKNIIHQK